MPKTETLFETGKSPQLGNIAMDALRKLDMLTAAMALEDLRSPPANRLEPLHRDREGQHLIRINDQFRVCLTWTPQDPARVEIVDYH